MVIASPTVSTKASLAMIKQFFEDNVLFSATSINSQTKFRYCNQGSYLCLSIRIMPRIFVRLIIENLSGVIVELGKMEILSTSIDGKKVKEQLVKCIWSEQLLKKDKLFTDDGLRIEIISSGIWNLEEGPDFKDAEILLEGQGLVKGDVEIHVCSGDWVRHGHSKQMAYADVCLHVFMWNDKKNKYVKYKNRLIPQLSLYDCLEYKLEKLADMIDFENYPHTGSANAGPCHKRLTLVPNDDKWIGHFLDYAGDERILFKSNIIEKQQESKTFEQIIYEAILESLGYKNNKEQFKHLGSIVSLNLIKSLVPLDISIKERSRKITGAIIWYVRTVTWSDFQV